MTYKTPEQHEAEMERRVDAMLRRDAKAYDRMAAREDAAAALIGELCREGGTVFYINIRDRAGRLTGKTKEGGRCDLINYLIRNRYV